MSDHVESDGVVSTVWELQLVMLGILIGNPKQLSKIDPEDFCDLEVRDLVEALRSDGSRDSKQAKIQKFLTPRGCGEFHKEGYDCCEAIVKRVKLDARFFEALTFIKGVTSNLGYRGDSEHKTEVIELLLEAGKHVRLE